MSAAVSFSPFDPSQGLAAVSQLSSSAEWPLHGINHEGSAAAKLDSARIQAYEAMLRWGQRPDREAQANLVFGPGYDVAALSDYFNALAIHGSDILPDVELVVDSLLKGANGVYAEALNDIYLSQQFTETASIDALTGLLIEEFGHGLDARINSTDAAGDEGDLFARLVLGNAITATELALIKAEDDSQTIAINGQQLKVEMNTLFNDRLYQVMRGDDNGVYTRSSADGETWTDWNIGGDSTKTLDTPGMTTFQGKLYQTIRGVDNGIYTRFSSDGTHWTSWTSSDVGGTLDAPSIEVFNNRLFQTVRGGDNGIYTRSSGDGITWESWRNDGGGTLDGPSVAKFGNRLVQSVRGGDNGIYTRFSDNGYQWTDWSNLGGGTYNTPEMASFNGQLYQAVRGGDNAIHMRMSTDGANWSHWQNTGGSVTSKISMVEFRGKLQQVAIGLDQNVYFRSSQDGQSWGEFRTSGNLTAIDSNYVVPQRTESQTPENSFGLLQYQNSKVGNLNSQNSVDYYDFLIEKRSNLTADISGNYNFSVEFLTEEDRLLNMNGEKSWILEPGRYKLKVSAANLQNNIDYNLSLTSTSLSGDIQNKGLSNWLGRDVDDDDRNYPEGVNLYHYNSDGTPSGQGIDPGKDTIIVIHGWISNSDDLAGLITATKQAYPNHQTLALDWRNPANDDRDAQLGAPRYSAQSIVPVAEWAHQTLQYLGIPAEKISLVGHSLGSYLGAKIGDLFGGEVNSLIALDPAFPGDQYDTNGNLAGHTREQNVIDFNVAAKKSIAFVVSDEHNLASIAGDTDRAETAENSFLVRFESIANSVAGATEAHGAVVGIFTDLVKIGGFNNGYQKDSFNANGEISLLAQGHEGVVEAEKFNGVWRYKDFIYEAGAEMVSWI